MGSGGGSGERREGFDDTVWFRLDIGRRQQADPRWLLPLLCRRGHITKAQVGAIRIAANETAVQIPRAVAQQFAAAVARSAKAGGEDEIRIERMNGAPDTRAPQRPRGRGPNRSRQAG